MSIPCSKTGALAESVERMLPLRKVGRLNPGRANPVIYRKLILVTT